MTEHASYLIVGASHAGREALAAIRMCDPDSRLVMLSRDSHPPYSPTVLPYVVSGRSKPERVCLANADWFTANKAELVLNATMAGVDPTKHQVYLTDGRVWSYDRLLLAMGADPAIPPLKGLDRVPYLTLRTLEDAVAIRERAASAKRAIVLGAGLVGMHAAETLAENGLDVRVVEMRSHVLAEYFDTGASERILEEFEKHGIHMMMGRRAEMVEPAAGGGCRLTLDGGSLLEADLLLVATGVRPVLEPLKKSGIATDKGILVDDRMRTNVDGIWAAGDIAQARGFLSGSPTVNGTLPEAVEQGRVAGADMADDEEAPLYGGGIPLNTYRFFGRHAVAIGAAATLSGNGMEVFTDEKDGYCRIVMNNNRLIGLASIDRVMDGGILWQLIRRRTDLSPVKDRFLAQPLETARALMSQGWR